MPAKNFAQLSGEIDAAVHTKPFEDKTTSANLNKLLKSLALELATLGAAPGTTANLETLLGSKAAVDSPAFTGLPTAPTPPPDANDTRLATAAFVQGVAALTRFNTAPPYVAVRPDGTRNTTFQTLRAATDWVGAGTVLTNRPGVGTNQNILIRGGVLDLQGMPLDMAGGDLHLYPGARIINNQLLYNGRIFLRGQGTNSIQGGVLAMQTFQQSGTEQELVLDGVTVTDYGLHGPFAGAPLGETATVGPIMVTLRNGSQFLHYPPDAATTVVNEGTVLPFVSPNGFAFNISISDGGGIIIIPR